MTTDALSHRTTQNEASQVEQAARQDQYTLWHILGIWIAVSLPMAILGWIVAPALSPDIGADPIGAVLESSAAQAQLVGAWWLLGLFLLMGAYHWHQPWMIPGGILSAALFFALPAKRFHSIWMAIIPHSMQIVVFGFLILGIVLGVA